MKGNLVVRAIAISSGIASIAIAVWTGWLSSAIRCNPLGAKAIPPHGANATFPFWAAAGTFRFTVYTSSIGNSLYSNPSLESIPVNCKLEVSIIEDSGLVEKMNITSLRYIAESGGSQTAILDGGHLALPKLGRYVLVISNLSDSSFRSESSFSFDRDLKPGDTAFGNVFGYLISFGLFGLCLLCIMILVDSRHSLKGESRTDSGKGTAL